MEKINKKALSVIREYSHLIKWNKLIINYILPEDFIKEFRDKLTPTNWENIFYFQELSEEFIREFKDKANWVYVSIHQSLSESFIIEFKDKVHWGFISGYQKLSSEFISKHLKILNKSNLLLNTNISDELKETIKLFL